MTDNKFTDKEIMKALECCSNLRDCCECSYFHDKPCIQLKLDALDLINRQNTEIERLVSRVSVLAEIEKDYALKYGNDFDVSIVKKQIRHEAVKEFAERLKKKAFYVGGFTYLTVKVDDIDNLVKEMVGEPNETE